MVFMLYFFVLVGFVSEISILKYSNWFVVGYVLVNVFCKGLWFYVIWEMDCLYKCIKKKVVEFFDVGFC